MKFDKHIFICTNQRDKGKESCGEAKGLKLVELFKKAIKQHKHLNIQVRAQRAGCLDVCEFGPALVVYPEGVFYGEVNECDVDEIIESHIIGNVPVERLRLKF